MAENTNIEWATHTFNPWRGCTKISEGCSRCYAETMSGRNPKTLGVWGSNGTRVVAAEAAWKEPLKWDRKAKEAGERHRVFCASLADVFEDWKGLVHHHNGRVMWCDPTVDYAYWQDVNPDNYKLDPWRRLSLADVRRRLFALIDATPNLDWLILTKRPENVLRMTYDAWCKKVPGHVSQNEGDGRQWAWPKNLWIGTSVENQSAANERIPHLLNAPAAVRFLSCEPLLGPIDLRVGVYEMPDGPQGTTLDGIDWVIVGGESGPGARPCDVAWIRSIVEQCKAAGTACFVKQLGATVDATVIVPHDGNYSSETQRLTLRDRKGGDMAEFPADLRIRQFPKTA